MKMSLELKISNIFGGDGFKRPDSIEEVKLARSKKKVTIREDMGIPIDDVKKERKTETKEIEVNTFKRDEEGNYYLRLGGSHGKLWGAIKEKALQLQRMTGNGKSSPFKSYKQIKTVMDAVLIKPEWIQLKPVDGKALESHKEQIFQEMGGMGHSAVALHFDVIPEAIAEVELEIPDLFTDRFKQVLDYLQGKYCLNKRRSMIEIQNEDEVFDSLQTAS